MKRCRSILPLFFALVLSLLMTAPACAASYTVVRGDCLWRIAARFLGAGERWPEIYRLNQGQIRDPDLIYPGQVFDIPDDGPGEEPVPVPDAAAAESVSGSAAADTDSTEPAVPDPAAAAEESPAEAEQKAEPAQPEAPDTPAPAEAEPPAEAKSPAPAEAAPAQPETSAQTAAEEPLQILIPTEPEPIPSPAPAAPVSRLSGAATDYANPENWLVVPKATKRIDTFYIYPTTRTDVNAPALVPVDDEAMRTAAQRNVENTCGVFEATNVFVPYYRQSSLNALAELGGDRLDEALKAEPRDDLFAALDYYFTHYNTDRPFILAGHGQGSALGLIALQEYMDAHPAYRARMIAAYLPGCSVTQKALEASDWLKFAERADDTGVIVSWNSEYPGNGENLCVREGALAINPLNWKRDETRADASESLGSRIVNQKNGKIYESSEFTADAQLDLSRGVVLCTNVNIPCTLVDNANLSAPFGALSYHDSDYALYYYSLAENVQTRIAAWNMAH